MGCGVSSFGCSNVENVVAKKPDPSFPAALLIQCWYRRCRARLEARRRCAWNIYQSLEYEGEQDQLKLYNFFNEMLTHLSPDAVATSQLAVAFNFATGSEKLDPLQTEPGLEVGSAEYKLLRLTDPELVYLEPDYSGPTLELPINQTQVKNLLEAFKNQQILHARYLLVLLHETRRRLKNMGNINQATSTIAKQITVIGDLHGSLDDLVIIFYKNGLPGSDNPYIFNGDFVDRGPNSVEVASILFACFLCNPNEVYLNRGNHEDHMMNLRYGFVKEIMKKYKQVAPKIIQLFADVFSWLPLATVIDQKILVVHGGVSKKTDMNLVERIDRHKTKRTLFLTIYHWKDWLGFRLLLVCEWTFVTTAEAVLADMRGNGSNVLNFHTLDNFQGYGVICDTLLVERLSQFRRSLQCSQQACTRFRFTAFPVTMFTKIIGISMANGLQFISALKAPQIDDETESDRFAIAAQREKANIDWKQLSDLLWSDPRIQKGSSPNTFRGCGSYFGADVTRTILEQNQLQMLIRSHECKEDGFEYTHSDTVLTIFSVSNYYEVGSNRGAYLKMLGPELKRQIIQYMASKQSANTRRASIVEKMGEVESSAVRQVREKVVSLKTVLLERFQQHDPKRTGLITLHDWCESVMNVTQLDLAWITLQPKLAKMEGEMVVYNTTFEQMKVEYKNSESGPSVTEMLYKNKENLETIFRLLDKDNSGQISVHEFKEACAILSKHLNLPTADIGDLAKSIDINKDGSIDFNEFLEAFRLVDIKRPSLQSLI